MFDRALVVTSPEGFGDAALPAVERIVPGNAALYHLRTLPGARPPEGRGSATLSVSRLRAAGDFKQGGVSIHRIVRRSDDPAHSVLELVDELEIDLVAMVDSGAGGFRQLLGPNVVEKVIESGHVPVLLVGKEWAPETPELRRVLVPFDPAIPPRPLLEAAAQVSRRAQAELLVLGLLSVPLRSKDSGANFLDRLPLGFASPEKRIGDLTRDLVATGCRARCIHAYEEPLEVIPRYARSLDADLILLSRLGCGRPGRLLTGSLARQLAESTQRPILFGGPALEGHRFGRSRAG